MKTKKAETSRKEGLRIAIISLAATALLLGSAAFSSAGQSPLEEKMTEAIALRVLASMNLPTENISLPAIAHVEALPGNHGGSGRAVGMYLNGTVYLLETLDSRMRNMVLAHELIHHYSHLYGLDLSETEVREQTVKAGYKTASRTLLARAGRNGRRPF